MSRGSLRRNDWILTPILILAVLFCPITAFGQEVPEKAGARDSVVESQPLGTRQAAIPPDQLLRAQQKDDSGVPQLPVKPGTEPVDHLFLRIAGSAFFIIVVLGAFLFYIFILQNRFFQACKDDKQMSTFFASPAGLPVGTVRAVISLIIVTVSLALIVLNVFKVGVSTFPEVLSGILGTVLGFYFGSRSPGGGDNAAQRQITNLTTQRDEAVATQDKAQADSLLSKTKDGIALCKTAVQFLPTDVRTKYEGIISKMEQGVGVAESLATSGNLKDAISKAGEVYDLFKKENPAQETFTKAVEAFGQVLGSSVPAVAIASTVVVLCAKLAGTVYQKWKARILHAPFSPAIIPLKVVDANTGLSLMVNSPIFKKAFAKELDANDRPFMEAVVALVVQTDVEAFWTRYQARFESREQFETGLEEFRRAAADLELQEDIPQPLVSEAGGYKNLVDSIDKINADTNAKAALDQLFVVTESLHKSGEPVLSILDKTKSGGQS